MAEEEQAPAEEGGAAEEAPAAEGGEQKHNPIVILILSLFSWAILGYFLMGHKEKAIGQLIWSFLFFIPIANIFGMILKLLGTYDSFLTAQKIEKGESVAKDKFEVDFLHKIPKLYWG